MFFPANCIHLNGIKKKKKKTPCASVIYHSQNFAFSSINYYEPISAHFTIRDFLFHTFYTSLNPSDILMGSILVTGLRNRRAEVLVAVGEAPNAGMVLTMCWVFIAYAK